MKRRSILVGGSASTAAAVLGNAFFVLSGFWTALVPAVSVVLARRGSGAPKRSDGVRLGVGGGAGYRRGGVRSRGSGHGPGGGLPAPGDAVGVDGVPLQRHSRCLPGTWFLIFGELLCWGVFGIHEGDTRLIVLGATASWPVCSYSRACRCRGHPVRRRTHLVEVS